MYREKYLLITCFPRYTEWLKTHQVKQMDSLLSHNKGRSNTQTESSRSKRERERDNPLTDTNVNIVPVPEYGHQGKTAGNSLRVCLLLYYT